MSADESQLTRFERQVLDLLIGATGDAATILSEQAAVATVVHRSTPGGSGAHVWLAVPDSAPRLRRSYSESIQALNGIVEAEDLPRLAAMFLLHVKSGALERVEIVAPDAPWPARPRLTSYAATGRRIGRDALP